MTDVDLIVAGAGGGLASAVRAAGLGKSVLVLEANEHFLRGNNTAMSTAMIPGAGSRFQRAAGIHDCPERFLADIAAKTAGEAEPAVSRALADVSARLVEWLADDVGLPIELPTDFGYPGHCVQRLHSIPGRNGTRLLRDLYGAARAHPDVDLLVPATLVDLAPLPAGGWTVTARTPDGEREAVTAQAVLLATNGYGACPELVARHLPEIADAAYHGSEHSKGDALRLGRAHGAHTGYLDAYQGHGALSAKARTLITWTAVMHGAVMTDLVGHRFGDETVGYSEYAALLAAQPGSAGWVVFDERVHELCAPFGDYRDADEAGAILSADNIAELAGKTRLDTDILAAELAETAAVARGDRDADRFGRRSFEAELQPPYRAAKVLPALFHTQGGLSVDAHARVLGDHGPIPGLYASGGAAAGISGHGAAGYLAGNGLLPALGLAYLAAEDFARHHAAEPSAAAREEGTQ